MVVKPHGPALSVVGWRGGHYSGPRRVDGSLGSGGGAVRLVFVCRRLGLLAVGRASGQRGDSPGSSNRGLPILFGTVEQSGISRPQGLTLGCQMVFSRIRRITRRLYLIRVRR